MLPKFWSPPLIAAADWSRVCDMSFCPCPSPSSGLAVTSHPSPAAHSPAQDGLFVVCSGSAHSGVWRQAQTPSSALLWLEPSHQERSSQELPGGSTRCCCWVQVSSTGSFEGVFLLLLFHSVSPLSPSCAGVVVTEMSLPCPAPSQHIPAAAALQVQAFDIFSLQSMCKTSPVNYAKQARIWSQNLIKGAAWKSSIYCMQTGKVASHSGFLLKRDYCLTSLQPPPFFCAMKRPI